MKRVNLTDMFVLPPSYQPPDIPELSTNTQYPNLNSLEYQHKVTTYELTSIPKYYEHFEINSQENVVLASNNYTGRIWEGSFWGFETIDDFGDFQKASYKLRCKAPITNIRYVEANVVNQTKMYSKI